MSAPRLADEPGKSPCGRKCRIAEDVKQLVAFESWRGRGIGNTHQSMARVLRSRDRINLKGLTPFLGSNRPDVTSVGGHEGGPAR